MGTRHKKALREAATFLLRAVVEAVVAAVITWIVSRVTGHLGSP
jgi:hypothetical protein